METSSSNAERLTAACVLSIAGGFLDIYTYLCRGRVFANAVTGNMVLFGFHLSNLHWVECSRYLLAILCYALGIFVADLIHRSLPAARRFSWHQTGILLEFLCLAPVCFIPEGEFDFLVNGVISFVCAMQVQTFRKVRGHAYASTMCIGNMRSGTEALCVYFHTHDREVLKKALTYFGVIGIFAVGAGLGSVLTARFAEKGIWVSCLLLAVSFLMMFVREEEKK